MSLEMFAWKCNWVLSVRAGYTDQFADDVELEHGTLFYRFVCIPTYGFLMPSVGQDFHLPVAKRQLEWDLALETDIATYLPSTLFLFWLPTHHLMAYLDWARTQPWPTVK